MAVVSQAGGNARPPWLQSWAALLGIAVLVLLSIYIGVRFWWARDPALAALTVAAELVAFAGLGVATWQWTRDRKIGLGAGVVTFLAAAWCAFTMFENLQAETRTEALAAAKERPAYIFAANAAQTAGRLLEDRLTHPNPRPTCTCPQTIAAWEASEAAAIDRLRNERDAAVQQMEGSMPEPRLEVLALVRGIGVEIAKLFGFVVFVLALGPPRRRRNQVVEEAVEQPAPQPLRVIEGGRSTTSATTGQPPQPPRSRRWLSAVTLWFGTLVMGAQHAAPVEATSAPTSQPPPPLPQPVVLVDPVEDTIELVEVVSGDSDLAMRARQLSGAGLGERRVATVLSKEAARIVTRHQVRILLGREKAAA